MPRQPDDYESFARDVVEAHLGVHIEWWDTGAAPGRPDWTWESAAGRAYLEVTRDVDPQAQAQAAALQKNGWELEAGDLEHGWYVVMEPSASVVRMPEVLPVLRAAEVGGLHGLGDDDDPDVAPDLADAFVGGVWDGDEYLRLRDLHAELLGPLRRLRVRGARAVPGARPGSVRLMSPSFGGVNPGPDVVADWLVDFLATRADDVEKLARQDCVERHLFVFVDITRSDLVFPYWLSAEQDVPRASVELPHGLTQVWLSGTNAQPRVLLYSAHVGWTEVQGYASGHG